jgi:sortase A
MYPHGVIYEQGISPKRGIVTLWAPLKTRVKYSLLRGLGAGLIGFAIIGLLFTYGPIAKEEVSYRLGLNHIDTTIAETIPQARLEAQNLGVDPYFSIVIPKIGAKASVLANIDPSNEQEYKDALQKGVAHAKGTYFPGQGKNIFLFSHSTNSPLNITRFNAVFYLLRKLETGDKIIIFFTDHKYEYVVEKKVITDPKDVSWLNDQGQGEQLVLQTCDPPGTTWHRLLVIARPVAVDNQPVTP